MSRKVHAYLVIAQLAFGIAEVVCRIALLKGTHPFSFTFYRNCCASVILGLIAWYGERGHERPSSKTLIYVFFLGFIGVTLNQVCFLIGLKNTSAIFASAMRNTTPVFTFVMAALVGIEKVNLKRRDGQLKVVGSFLGLCGSVVLSLYRGPIVLDNVGFSFFKRKLTSSSHPANANHGSISLYLFHLVHLSLSTWAMGAMFLTVSCAAFGLYLILQAPVLSKHPMPFTFAALSCFSSVIQLPLFGHIFQPELETWKPGPLPEIVAVLYMGLVASGLVSSIQSWGVSVAGPVIVAAFQPLETVFTAVLSMIFLNEALRLGSILGGLIVIAGLYMLIWGQNIEHELEESTSTSDTQLPGINMLELPDFCEERFKRAPLDLEIGKDNSASKKHMHRRIPMSF